MFLLVEESSKRKIPKTNATRGKEDGRKRNSKVLTLLVTCLFGKCFLSFVHEFHNNKFGTSNSSAQPHISLLSLLFRQLWLDEEADLRVSFTSFP